VGGGFGGEFEGEVEARRSIFWLGRCIFCLFRAMKTRLKGLGKA
jgi:hypothetical protein